MKEALQAITEELKRLRAEGDDSIPVDDDTVNALAKFALSLQEEAIIEAPQKIEFIDKLDVNINVSKKEEELVAKKLKLVNTNPDFQIAEIPKPTPFSLPEGDKQARWNFLKDLVLNDKVCKSHLRPEKNIVFGIGNLDADIFFCGEAPGADEEIQAEPFVGKAGQLLTKIIGAMGLKREDVYIGNIMNWRPELPTKTGNRPPTQEEMTYCLPYLKAQIEIVKPKVVVALGMTAVNGLLGPDPKRKLGAIRGKWSTFEGADLMITYHPSFLLQYANAEMKRLVWEDMLAVMERVGLPISEKQKAFFK